MTFSSGKFLYSLYTCLCSGYHAIPELRYRHVFIWDRIRRAASYAQRFELSTFITTKYWISQRLTKLWMCVANLWRDSISFPKCFKPPKRAPLVRMWRYPGSPECLSLQWFSQDTHRVTSHLLLLLFATVCTCLCNLWNWQESSKKYC